MPPRPAQTHACIKAVASLLAFAAGVLQWATAQDINFDDSSVWVAENGGTYTQEVWLGIEPTANVTVQVASGNTSAVTVSPTTLTFTPTNYTTKQHVTYTGVDDNLRNSPPAHRSATVTYTASGGNYDGVSSSVTVLAFDDEPIVFTVVEGLSYDLTFYYLVEQGCAPAVIDFVASDVTLLGLSPQSHSWTEQDSNQGKKVRHTFHYNNAIGDHRVSLERRVTVPCGRPFPFQEVIFNVQDRDTWDLNVEGLPACGATVRDNSVQPRIDFLLKPAPSVEMATEYRPISDDNSEGWQGSLPVGTSGRSISFYHSPMSSMRRSHAGFAGFEYRLKDAPNVTAQCTWKFEDAGVSPPTVRLSAAPNPVTEGSSVTVTARLSEALTAEVTIPLTLTDGTAESGDYGPLAGITIPGGQTSGTGAITTAQDADTDDETFTVSLGGLPSLVTAGSPNSVTVSIRDDDRTTPPPTVSLSASPNPVDEGEEVTVTARLSAALSSAVTIPLTLTAITAEEGDYGPLASITIPGGQTTGTGAIATAQDADSDDETFTVSLGGLPPLVAAGSPSSVQVTIRDNDDGGEGGIGPVHSVSLSASPNPVDEGGAVTVTARLSPALSSAVTIPLTLTAITAEEGDYGPLASITIAGGSTTGTGTITTAQDADTDDETFTVSLGSLPLSVAAGSPSSVTVTINDTDGGEGDGGGGTPTNRPPTVTASCDRCTVTPSGEVRLRAEASDPDGDPLTFMWSAPLGRFEGAVDGASARWRAPGDTGKVVIRVQVPTGVAERLRPRCPSRLQTPHRRSASRPTRSRFGRTRTDKAARYRWAR